MSVNSALTLTVVIPTKNRRTDLERLLRSLMSQLGPTDEILVIDNGSTDGTPELVGVLSTNRPNLKLITDPAPSVSRIINRATAQCSGQILGILNDDVVPSVTWVSEIKHWFDCLPDAAIIGGSTIDMVDRRIRRAVKQSSPLLKIYDRLVLGGRLLDFGVMTDWGGYSIGMTTKNAPTRVTGLTAANMAVRVDVWHRLGMFDERVAFNHFDALFFIKAAKAGFPIYSVPGPTVQHFTGTSGSTRSAYNLGLDTAIFFRLLRPSTLVGRVRWALNVLSFLAFWLVERRVEGSTLAPSPYRGFFAGTNVRL